MSARQLTSEERRLWREATRRDKKLRQQREEETPEEAATKSPPRALAKPVPTAPLPPRKKPVTATPRMLGVREAKKTFKNYPIDATLDLHGLSRSAAYEAVMKLLTLARRRGWRHLLIVTGKGKDAPGVLRAALPGWLAERGAEVIAIAEASREKGGSGAFHVLVRKPR